MKRGLKDLHLFRFIRNHIATAFYIKGYWFLIQRLVPFMFSVKACALLYNMRFLAKNAVITWYKRFGKRGAIINDSRFVPLFKFRISILCQVHNYYFAAYSVRGEDCGSYPALVGNMVGEKLYKVNAQSITKLPQLFYPEISLRNKIQNFHNLSETFDRWNNWYRGGDVLFQGVELGVPPTHPQS